MRNTERLVLRDYQARMLGKARHYFERGARRVVLVAPTGSGKRVMAIRSIAEAEEQGRRCVFLVHRQELLNQAVETITDAGLRCGVIKSGHRPNYRLPIQVASVQTLARRLDKIGRPFDEIHCDEVHHCRSKTWEAVLAAWPEARVVGYTATPARMDGRGLGKWFDRMVVGPFVRKLIEDGHLANYRLFAPSSVDVSGVGTVAGDYNRSQLAAAVDQPRLVGDVVEHYRRLADGTQAICFAVNIAHSRHLTEAFAAAGISARHVDGETDQDERDQIMRDFAERRFSVLCNVEILGEGVDVAGIETVICARPTKSLTLHLQQLGRGLRPKPDGRAAVLLDHAGNSLRLGLPDEEHEWRLTEDRVGGRRGEAPVRVCPRCAAVVPIQTQTCPECGVVLFVREEAPTHASGRLTEIERAREKRDRHNELVGARTYEDLVNLGTARGYTSPGRWAAYVLAGRKVAYKRYRRSGGMR